jgi:hypothetical protein
LPRDFHIRQIGSDRKLIILHICRFG